MAAPDPFTAAFSTPTAAPTPATASSSPVDAFEAAFGHVTPSSKTSAPVASSEPVENLSPFWAGVRNVTGHIVESVPIVGPMMKKGLEQAAALDEAGVRRLEALDVSQTKRYPTGSAVGDVIGSLAGYGAIAAAAPAAFGMEAATLPKAAAISGATNAVLNMADAAMRGQDPVKAGEVGGALGVFAPVVGVGLSKMFTNVIQPHVAQLADLAINKFGIPLGPDLISTNPMLRFASSVMERMPFSGGTATREARLGAFTRAVAREMGEDAEALTPDVMRRAKTRIGQDFEYAAKNTPTLGADQQFGDDLTRIWQEVNDPVDRALAVDERKVIEGQMKRVIELYNKGNGSITGQQYQQLTRRGTALDRATSSDNPNIRHYAIQLKSALDDALMRFAPADAADTLKQARQQWWAMKTIEDLAEKAPTGHVSPALLMGAVRSNTGNMAYGGGGNLAELARIGQLFLKDAPSSGTAERTLIMALAEAVGGSFGYFLHHPLAWAAGLTAPAAVGRVAASVARSPRLGNALVRSATGNPGPVGKVIQAGSRGGRYLLPGLVQQARPIAGSYLPADKERGRYVR